MILLLRVPIHLNFEKCKISITATELQKDMLVAYWIIVKTKFQSIQIIKKTCFNKILLQQKHNSIIQYDKNCAINKYVFVKA